MLKFKVTDHTDYIKNGSTFFAFKGKNFDGTKLIIKAIEKGAERIFIDFNTELDDNTNLLIKEKNIKIIKSNKMLIDFAIESLNAYNLPNKKLKLIGITGTKGKTSTAYICEKILRENNIKSALISTAECSINGNIIEKSHLDTTPKIDYISYFLNECINNNVTYVVIEVSAQAYTSKRIYGLEFDSIIGTNISMEHGEYYPDQKDYFKAKHLFMIENIKNNGYLIINDTDENIKNVKNYINENLNKKINLLYFGKNENNNLNYEILENNLNGSTSNLKLNLNEKKHLFNIKTSWIGEHTIQNICGAILGILSINEIDLNLFSKNLQFLSNLKSIKGRLEYFNLKNNIHVYIDRAHTPSSFESVLSSIKQNCSELTVIFGAGGNKDREKRPIMAKIAEKYSDIIYITSDNPRTENILQITLDILNGFNFFQNKEYIIINDREKAIKKAINNSKNNSVIAILGKGDEEYIEIMNEKIPYSDEKIIKNFI